MLRVLHVSAPGEEMVAAMAEQSRFVGPHEWSRFTAGDEVTVVEAVGRLVQTAVNLSTTGRPNHDRLVLRRAAAHSVGCSIFDLRESELEVIDRIVEEQIAGRS